MKRIDSILVLLIFVGIGFSCGQSSRDKIHEQVVEEERADPQDMLGQDNGEYAQEFEVVAENMRYNPSEIRVDAGRTVRIQLINRGDEEHNIEVELPTGERELDNNLKPGEQGILEFTAPAQGGTYTIYCPVDDHKEQGMTAQLIVE
jgi:plastocyanin